METKNQKQPDSYILPASEFWRNLIDLKTGVDKLGVIEEIKSKKSMNGANAWMLMCSIMIASIGLNMNSPAVIIGAMLISPLMSPILGIGLAVGINDKTLLKKALRHFGAATLIAILTSTLYFVLSPFEELTSEIQARTTPTFLDIIIAFFGGIAGIVSIARKDISTTIPGVAIATALMPPLCVAGYGLAHGQWGIASSSFYLFFLNTLFVSIATYFIIRYLKFPYKQFVNKKERRRNLSYVAGFVMITMIPSLFIFNKIYKSFKTEQSLKQFINTYIGEDNLYLDEYDYIQSDSINRLIMKVYGDAISEEKLDYYRGGLDALNLKNTKIEIIPTSEIKLSNLKSLESKITGVEKLASQLQVAREENRKKDQMVDFLETEVANNSMDSIAFVQLCKELKIIYPNIKDVSISFGQRYDYDTYLGKHTILLLRWDTSVARKTISEHNEKIENWIKIRDDFEIVRIVSEY